MAPKWRRSIYWRALEEAISSLGIETGERALIAAAVVAVGFTFVWLAAGWDVAKSQLPIILASSAAFILIFFLVYFLKIFTIPKQSVQIVIGNGEPYETRKPYGINSVRIIRVMLKNNTSSEISNGALHIRNLEPPNNGFSDLLLESSVTIGPHTHTFIDVASFGGSWIQFIIPHPGGYFMSETFNRLPVKSHKFHLIFSSLDETFDEIYCRLFIDFDHKIQLEEWS
jgi:hypothetical protein